VSVFFTDRDLGNLFPAHLKLAGLDVERHADHFRHDAPDEDWLREVAQSGWFVLTHDQGIRYKPNELRAVMESGIGLFVLVGSATHDELAENFVATAPAVERFILRHPRPFIAKILRPSPVRGGFARVRPGRVVLWVSEQ